MTTFKYTAQSQEERDNSRFNILPQGNYYFEILSADLHTSKASGKQMVKLTLAVKQDKYSDNYNQVFDYLSDGKFGYKIADLYKSIGHEDMYFREELNMEFVKGKSGYLKLGIRPANGQYGPSNTVLDYITKSNANVKEENLVPISSDEDFDDAIPF
jgi:hypothetical protein